MNTFSMHQRRHFISLPCG